MRKSKVYLILQAAVCCALAELLAASAISIYRDGMARRAVDPMAAIYTPELVSEKLASVAPLFFAALGLLIAGVALGIRGEGIGAPVKGAAMPAVPPRKRGTVRAALLIAAAALIVAGIANGSARDVLYKAITICTECVGLG